MLVAKGFGSLLANAVSQQHVTGITLPKSQAQLVNGHFADDSFLTLLEEENNIKEILECLNIFFLTSSFSI